MWEICIHIDVIILAQKIVKKDRAAGVPPWEASNRHYVSNPDITINSNVRKIYGDLYKKIFMRAMDSLDMGKYSGRSYKQIKVRKVADWYSRGPITQRGGEKKKKKRKGSGGTKRREAIFSLGFFDMRTPWSLVLRTSNMM